MDALDKEIISLLQDDGRATMTAIASRVGLSLSACHRRFRELESAGIIRGFRLELDNAALGLTFESLVFVSIAAGNHDSVAEFEDAVGKVPSILRVQRLFGEPDYQLHVVSSSVQDFQRLYDEVLTKLPGVHRLTSTLIMKNVKDEPVHI